MNRRQVFITESYYRNMRKFYDEAESFWCNQILDEDHPGQGAALRAYEIKSAIFKGLLLRYTAGEPIASLVPNLENLITQYEKYQQKLQTSENLENVSPLNIEKLVGHYEEFIQVVSLCILLHRHDLLIRFVKLTDQAGFAGDDALYEELLANVLPHRYDADEWYHKMYTPLIATIDADTPTEAATLLNRYCKGWYPSFENSSTYWHDTHLDMEDDEGSYFGYWALEAGAIAYLHNIDDSQIQHMVYPRDLVEYARNHTPRKEATADPAKLYAGQSCTRTGFWYTPAQNNSRHFFSQGDVMPEFKDSPWGATIWYWSGEKE